MYKILGNLDQAARSAMDYVRQMAEDDPSVIVLGSHAKDQMEDRDLVFRDIQRVLKSGDIVGVSDANEDMRPEWGNADDEVRIVVTFRPKGAREIAVATIVVRARKRVFVKTVMWRDEK